MRTLKDFWSEKQGAYDLTSATEEEFEACNLEFENLILNQPRRSTVIPPARRDTP